MGTPIKDVAIPENAPKELLLSKHADYIGAYGSKKDDYEYVMTEYLRMNGIYWGLTAMDLMDELKRMNKEEVLVFVKRCQHETGGISCSVGHDPHLLCTLSAIQILTLYDAQDTIDCDKVITRAVGERRWAVRQPAGSSEWIKILTLYDAQETIDCDKVIKWVQSLQQDDGSFYGDKWGEVDTRFSFCAVACLSLLGKLDSINVDKAVEFVVSCMNFDGGFGCRPGSESHSGQIYCCVGMLAITGQLHHINADLLGWWLCERQLPSGGLNGRPEKLPDVCYSWWVLASLKIINRLHWIDKNKLIEFILASQDEETGGFADRPGDMVDPFHTLFGLTGLSLLGNNSIKPVNPVYCMPEDTIRRVGIQLDLL